MNVVYHHRTRGLGAEGIHIREIYNAFKDSNHKIKMVSITNKDILESNNIKSSKKYNPIKQHFIKILRKIFALIYNFPGYYLLNKSVDENTDFIYERYSVYNFVGVWVSEKLSIPLILEVNAPYAHEVEEHEKPLFPKLSKKVEVMIFKKATRIIVVSDSLKQYLIKLGTPHEKILVMHNGVNFKKFNHELSGKRIREKYLINDEIVIGFIGGLESHHGLSSLFKALTNIDIEVVLLLVGSGSLEPELKTLATEISLRVIFVGNVSHEVVPEYIAAMDICIKPDSNEYCSPMKIFEYMAMKKPIIAGDTISVREILNNERALLIEPTAYNIGTAIKKLSINANYRSLISNKGYNHVVKNYSWGKNVKEIVDEVTKLKQLND